jgi:hypothetical protein
MADQFGLTNDEQEIDEVSAFREAAIADGWEAKPGSAGELIESYAYLTKDGFTMHVLARRQEGMKFKFQASVNIWGPDGLAIQLTGPIYDWESIKAGLRRCAECGKEDVDTQRYSFAGRCCADCRPELAKKHEYTGWTN